MRHYLDNIQYFVPKIESITKTVKGTLEEALRQKELKKDIWNSEEKKAEIDNLIETLRRMKDVSLEMESWGRYLLDSMKVLNEENKSPGFS